jgi:hypothetical protein
MATSFSGGRSRGIRREPLTMGKQLVNFITCDCELLFNPPLFNKQQIKQNQKCIYTKTTIKNKKKLIINHNIAKDIDNLLVKLVGSTSN